jgi:8-amino-7-oxononanoate synthase
LLKQSDEAIKHLNINISLFKSLIAGNVELIGSDSSIQCILLKSNKKAREMAAKLQNKGLDVRAILSPTVPQGLERIRICLHTYNTADEISLLANTINQYHNG